MIPAKLNKGDEIRIIAPSGSLSRVRTDVLDSALAHLHECGFKVTFSKHSRENGSVLLFVCEVQGRRFT